MMLENQNNMDSIECIAEGRMMALLLSLPLSKRQIEWSFMLCSIGDVNCFLDCFQNSASAELGIMKYRRNLHEQCMIVVECSELCDSFNEGNDILLHNLLQDLFLEVITQEQYTKVIEYISNDCNNIINIYQAHKDNKNKKMQKVLRELEIIK